MPSQMNTVHSDERRSVFEEVVRMCVERFTLLQVYGAADLGNHFHRRTSERFFLTAGQAILVTQQVDEYGSPKGERQECELVAPACVSILPFVAHVFRFKGPAQLISLSDKPFEQND